VKIKESEEFLLYEVKICHCGQSAGKTYIVLVLDMKIPKKYSQPFFEGLEKTSQGYMKNIKDMDRVVWIIALAIKEGLEKRKRSGKKISKNMKWYLEMKDPTHLI